MTFREGPIDGVVARAVQRYEDDRGWLVELYRQDQLDPAHFPAMAYLSQTEPGASRGPHEHRRQGDYFVFLGPGDFRLYLWDTRPDSPTRGNRMTLAVGESNRRVVIVPCGVVHGYKNVGGKPAWVFNAPNRLYAGRLKREPVDEIRHEDDPHTPFVFD